MNGTHRGLNGLYLSAAIEGKTELLCTALDESIDAVLSIFTNTLCELNTYVNSSNHMTGVMEMSCLAQR